MYERTWLNGLLALRRIDLMHNHNCWLFVGFLNEHGYGYYCNTSVHKLAVLEWGDCDGNDVTDGYDTHVHHKCEVRNCFNPQHLKVVTPSEHVDIHLELQGRSRREPRSSTTAYPVQFCPQGHDTFVVGRNKNSNCKKCEADRNAARRKKIKSANAS